MRRLIAALVLVTGAANAQEPPAGDVVAGRKIAAGICQACHGLDGIAKLPDMPTIAAASPGYLYQQLQAYKSGARQNELMAAVAPMLDDQKMADAAAYYGAIELTPKAP